MDELNTRLPLSEYTIQKIAERYHVLIFKGTTIDNQIYVRLDKIYLINRKFLFVNDTGYGSTYEEACEDLINSFLNIDYRIRYNELYATSIIRLIIKSSYKKYEKENINYDNY